MLTSVVAILFRNKEHFNDLNADFDDSNNHVLTKREQTLEVKNLVT